MLHMTDNGDIFRLLLLMLLLVSDREGGGSLTGTLNTMMIMAFLAAGSPDCVRPGTDGSTFPDST